MTNSTKKPAKASRENLDLDLDARLDQATSTLSLDNEPVVGDALDQILASAKKELDADNLSKEEALLPAKEEFDDLDGLLSKDDFENAESEPFSPIRSESLTSLENQLSAAMGSVITEDEELDNLLNGGGFDFDSLLGETSNDELIMDTGDEALMAAVDELLNIGVLDDEPEIIEPEVEANEEAVIEPEPEPKPKSKRKTKSKPEPDVEPEIIVDEIVELEPNVEPEIIVDEIVELEPEVEPEIIVDEIVELEPDVEPEIIVDEIIELEPEVEPEIIVDEIVEVEPEIIVDEIVELEPDVEPEIIVDEIVELEPDVEPEIIVDEIIELEPKVEPEIIVDEIVELEPEVEPEIIVDEIVELEPEVEPEIIVDEIVELEPEVEPEIIDEIVELEPEVEPEENELESDFELTVDPEAALDDLVDTVPFEDVLAVDIDDSELDDIQEEFNDFDDVADIDAPLVEMPTSIESFEDDLDEMQQLDGLNDAMENKNDTAGFDLLDDDAIEKERATPVIETADDDDWMKQLDDLDNLDTDKTEEIAPVNLAKPIEEAADDDDWMKQLDDLDNLDTDKAEEVTPVNLEKPIEEAADDDDWMKQLDGLDAAETEKTSESSDDDDWMKQLDNLDDHDEDTAKMLMDAGHGQDTDEDEIIDSRFNIADEDEQQNSNQSKPIDENALITKAAALAIDQIKEDQDHAFSQLRADQDTFESKSRKQFAEAENKRKKSATFGYIALGVGVIGVLGSAGIGWMSYGTKNEATNLTQTVTALDEKVNTFLAKNPEKEIENIKTSVEQLNQKVEKIAAAQVVAPPVAVATTAVETSKTSPTPAKSNSSIDLLNSNKTTPTVSTTSIDAPKIADSAIVPPIDISPAPPVPESTLAPVMKAAEPVKLADMAKKPAEAVKAKEKSAAKAETDKASAKAEAELLSQKIAKATAVAKAAAASNSKAEEQRKLLMQSKAERYKGRMTRGMTRAGKSEKDSTLVETAKTKNAVAKPATKEVLNAAIKPQKAVAVGKYSVNVISYQQEWFAQSKAAEFKQKGIPVEVVPIDASNPATKFRLKVGGFKNKAEADVYSNKVKKSLNLKETWVGSTD